MIFDHLWIFLTPSSHGTALDSDYDSYDESSSFEEVDNQQLRDETCGVMHFKDTQLVRRRLP